MTSEIKTTKNAPLTTAYIAIVIVSVMIVMKAFAYFESGSLSILSSLTDSVLDSIVSLMALGSIYYASRPADEDHRWGHGKMEAVSALFQSAIIAGGGVFLVFEAVNRFFHPLAIKGQSLGISVLIASIVLSVLLVFIQRRTLKETDSLAIEADSVHYGSDILINLGAAAVILGSLYNAPLWLDGVFTIGVAAFMGITSRHIALKSLNMLLDRELPEEERQKIIDVIEAHDGVLGWHDLRTHKNGADYVMSFDIEAQPEQTLFEAHEIAKDLEEGILKLYPNSDIIIHVDPKGYTEDSRHRVKGVHH